MISSSAMDMESAETIREYVNVLLRYVVLYTLVSESPPSNEFWRTVGWSKNEDEYSKRNMKVRVRNTTA